MKTIWVATARHVADSEHIIQGSGANPAAASRALDRAMSAAYGQAVQDWAADGQAPEPERQWRNGYVLETPEEVPWES